MSGYYWRLQVRDKKFAEEQMKIALAPIEKAISDFAVDILKNVRSAFIGTESQHNTSIEYLVLLYGRFNGTIAQKKI